MGDKNVCIRKFIFRGFRTLSSVEVGRARHVLAHEAVNSSSGGLESGGGGGGKTGNGT